MGTLMNEKNELLYSFFNADQICDFLLSIGMKPFVELSFMPTTLATGQNSTPIDKPTLQFRQSCCQCCILGAKQRILGLQRRYHSTVSCPGRSVVAGRVSLGGTIDTLARTRPQPVNGTHQWGTQAVTNFHCPRSPLATILEVRLARLPVPGGPIPCTTKLRHARSVHRQCDDETGIDVRSSRPPCVGLTPAKNRLRAGQCWEGSQVSPVLLIDGDRVCHPPLFHVGSVPHGAAPGTRQQIQNGLL